MQPTSGAAARPQATTPSFGGARRTRVLFVQGAAERAGAELMLANLVRFLDRSAFDPAVAFLDDGPFVAEIEALGASVLRLPRAPRLRALHRWPATVGAIRRAIESAGADVVHANGEKMSVLAGWAARLARRPAVFWLHDAPGSNGAGGRLAQAAMAATPRAAIVACAGWVANDFRRLGMRPRPIPNGLDLAALPSDGADVREELGLPRDAVVVTHVARLQRWKGTHVFVRAAARVAARRADARFLVVGAALYGREVQYESELRGLAVELGLGDRLIFTGYRSDATRVMAASDVIAHCSIEPDPFPTVVIEGMALGKAVVATRSRGPEEALDDGRTGVLVPRGDDAALAWVLERLIRSPQERARLGSAAARDACARYSAERMARDFEALYREIVADGRPG